MRGAKRPLALNLRVGRTIIAALAVLHVLCLWKPFKGYFYPTDTDLWDYLYL